MLEEFFLGFLLDWLFEQAKRKKKKKIHKILASFKV